MATVSIATQHIGLDGVSVENADIPRGTVRASGDGFPSGAVLNLEAISRDGTRSISWQADIDGRFVLDIAMPKVIANYYDDIPQVTWKDDGNVWAARVGNIKLLISYPAKTVRGESADTIKDRVVAQWR